MEKATRIAATVLFASAGLALLLGLIVWVTGSYSLIGMHQLLGYALVASLWSLAWIAWRSGVRTTLVAGAVTWGVLVLALGWSQEYLVTGDLHWLVRVGHAAISMTCVPIGRYLVAAIRQGERTPIAATRM